MLNKQQAVQQYMHMHPRLFVLIHICSWHGAWTLNIHPTTSNEEAYQRLVSKFFQPSWRWHWLQTCSAQNPRTCQTTRYPPSIPGPPEATIINQSLNYSPDLWNSPDLCNWMNQWWELHLTTRSGPPSGHTITETIRRTGALRAALREPTRQGAMATQSTTG